MFSLIVVSFSFGLASDECEDVRIDQFFALPDYSTTFQGGVPTRFDLCWTVLNVELSSFYHCTPRPVLIERTASSAMFKEFCVYNAQMRMIAVVVFLTALLLAVQSTEMDDAHSVHVRKMRSMLTYAQCWSSWLADYQRHTHIARTRPCL
jgi:hypothetical protein